MGSWTSEAPGERWYLSVDERGVEIGGGAPFGDSHGSYTHHALLSGELDDEIRGHHGAIVLRDAIDEARRLRAREESQAARSDALLRFLRSIPVDRRLATLASPRLRPDDWGELHYSNAGGTTCLSSDARSLVYRSNSGQLWRHGNAFAVAHIDFERALTEDGIAWRDHFYVVHGRSIAIVAPDERRLDRKDDRDMFGGELRIVGVRRRGSTVGFLYQWFDSRRPVDGVLRFDRRAGRFAGRWDIPAGAPMPLRPPAPALRSWAWKVGSSREMGCTAGHGALEWYGDELRGLSKGPFTVGTQGFDDFLLDGPPRLASAPAKIVGEIRSHVLEGGWPRPRTDARTRRKRERARVERVRAREARAGAAATAPMPPAPWILEPGERSARLEIVLRTADGASIDRLDLRFEVARPGSDVAGHDLNGFAVSAAGVIAFQGRVRAGLHRVRATVTVGDGDAGYRSVVGAIHELRLTHDAWVLLELTVGPNDIRARETRLDDRRPSLLFRVEQVLPSSQRLVSLRAQIDDVLACDTARPPRGNADSSGATLVAFDGFATPGRHVAKLVTQVLVDGEVDPRVRAHDLAFDVAKRGETRIDWGIPAESRELRADQIAKVARIAELERAIADAMRAGGVYAWGDKEGDHDELRFEHGRFAGTTSGAITTDQDLLRRIVDYHRVGDEDRIEVLTSALASIRRDR